MKPLIDRIAVVAGATRGAGRGIACMLGEAGATVYCTGRSVAGHPPAGGAYAGRPETIEQTAAMVREHGGVGHAVRVDHGDASQVADLVAAARSRPRPRRYSRARLLGRRPAGAVRHAVLVDSHGRWPADDRAHAVAARDHPAGARAADAAGSDGRSGSRGSSSKSAMVRHSSTARASSSIWPRCCGRGSPTPLPKSSRLTASR